jgi:hypothetical protein
MKSTFTVLHISKIAVARVRSGGTRSLLHGFRKNVGQYRIFSDIPGSNGALHPSSKGDITSGKPGGGGSEVVGGGETVGDIDKPSGGGSHTRLRKSTAQFRTFSDISGGIGALGTSSKGDITSGKPGGGGSEVVETGEPAGDLEPDGKPGGGGSERTKPRVDGI